MSQFLPEIDRTRTDALPAKPQPKGIVATTKRKLLFPVRFVDHAIHVRVYRSATRFQERWKMRPHEFQYLLAAPLVALYSGSLADPTLAVFGPHWSPTRRFFAFTALSLVAWTAVLVKLFDAHEPHYRYKQDHQDAAVLAHYVAWFAGLFFHPRFASNELFFGVLVSDLGWVVLLFFGLITVMWHFADWFPKPAAPSVPIETYWDPIPKRPNPYQPYDIPLSPHRDWASPPERGSTRVRGARMTPVDDLFGASDDHWSRVEPDDD